MLLQEIESDPDLKRLVFDFFYCFSRFEFSLKANEHAKKNGKIHPDENEIHKVAADWGKFWRTYEKSYVLSNEARELLGQPPLLQVIDKNGGLDFITEVHKENYTELRKVIVSIQRIRNNLFHGGKHGANGEDDLERNKFLLEKGKIILDQLAELDPDIAFDYPGGY